MKHSEPEVLEALDLAWDPEAGVLGKMRAGDYDAALADGYLELLDRIEIGEGEPLHPDFVKLLWFAPLFCEWQIERCAESGGGLDREVSSFSNRVCDRVMELLGVP
ncbi:hypothetical protein [Streptomyces mashuensis]|nr:hypothetical protein [Streptomyces mashuensis]